MNILRPKKANVFFTIFFNFACKCDIIDDRFQIRFKKIVNIPIFNLGQQIMRWQIFFEPQSRFSFLVSGRTPPPPQGSEGSEKPRAQRVKPHL